MTEKYERVELSEKEESYYYNLNDRSIYDIPYSDVETRSKMQANKYRSEIEYRRALMNMINHLCSSDLLCFDNIISYIIKKGFDNKVNINKITSDIKIITIIIVDLIFQNIIEQADFDYNNSGEFDICYKGLNKEFMDLNEYTKYMDIDQLEKILDILDEYDVF